MGGEQSVSEVDADTPTINHPKFRNVQFLKGNQIMKTNLSLDNYADFQKWEDQLNKVAKFDDEVLLLPKAYECIRKAVCGSSAALSIEFDNYPYILHEELENRFKINKHFSQEEIWYLLFSLCQAAHDFRSVNSKVGDIRPSNIFINEEGQIKVSNLYSWPCETTNYDKSIFDKELTYIAPEEVQGTKHGKVQMFIDKYLAESFSLGLTVLETGLLQSCSKLYNPKANTFNKYQLSKIMQEWWDLSFIYTDEQTSKSSKQEYSVPLKLAIAALCDINPEERLNSQDVYNWLKPHKDQINSLKKFQSGLPVVNNMKKYQPFLQKYQQPQVIHQQPIKLQSHYGAQQQRPVTLNQPVPAQYYQHQPQSFVMQPPVPQVQKNVVPQYSQPPQSNQPTFILPNQTNQQTIQPPAGNQQKTTDFVSQILSMNNQPNTTQIHTQNTTQKNTVTQNTSNIPPLVPEYAVFNKYASENPKYAFEEKPVNHDEHGHDRFFQYTADSHLNHVHDQKTIVSTINPVTNQTYITNPTSQTYTATTTYKTNIQQTNSQYQPLATISESEIKQDNSKDFLKKIDEALAISRKNNPI